MDRKRLEHLRRIARLGGLGKAKKRRPVLDRFKENIKTDPVTGCWLWTKNLSRGYGSFKVNGKITKASRWAYEFFKKEKIPSPKIFVCHHCDVRKCVNPDHLFLGTHQDNMDDGKKKKRFQSGFNHHGKKLNREQELNIINSIRRGESVNELALRYNVSRQLIWRLTRS